MKRALSGYTHEVELLTLGHGTASEDDLAQLIRDAGIEHVADVRSVPKSRRLPHVWSDELAKWIPELTKASYSWMPGLGGFRKAKPDSSNSGLRNPSFRGYADYMETPGFRAALDELLANAAHRRTAILCSESLWWRCHRRLVADAAQLLHDAGVVHLGHDGRLRPHVLTEGVRRTGDILRYAQEPS